MFWDRLGRYVGKVLELAYSLRTARGRPTKGVVRLTTSPAQPYLKYALFCRDTETDSDDDLTFKGVIDLVELPEPAEPPGPDSPFLTQVDVNLAFCIAEATPGTHHLMVAIKAPGIPLETPPPQTIDWEEDILFQRWIKTFRIPVQRAGTHVAAILLDGTPLGEASFMVRFKKQG